MIERTLVLIKPDGVQRSLIGECIRRFEQRGLKVVGLKMVRPDSKTIGSHYTEDLEWLKSVGAKTRQAYEKKGVKHTKTDEQTGRDVRQWLMDYLSSGPIVAVAVEGYHAVEAVRKIVGVTEPLTAQPGTIRGDFSVDSYTVADGRKRPLRNMIHASGNVKEAAQEINVWFSENELHTYERHDWAALHH